MSAGEGGGGEGLGGEGKGGKRGGGGVAKQLLLRNSLSSTSKLACTHHILITLLAA